LPKAWCKKSKSFDQENRTLRLQQVAEKIEVAVTLKIVQEGGERRKKGTQRRESQRRKEDALARRDCHFPGQSPKHHQ